MTEVVKRLGPWLPLLIVAGYFLFLVATYVKVVSTLKLAAVTKVSEPKPAE